MPQAEGVGTALVTAVGSAGAATPPETLGPMGQGFSLRLGLESPFVPRDAGYVEFSSELVKELDGMAKKMDIILEEECRDIFSVVATRIFSHLLLYDPHSMSEEVMVHVPKESRDGLGVAVEGHLHTLLEMLSCDDDKDSGEDPPPLP
ncbi:hypothetical protein D1007_20673 [Hordeum vulgare]|nr:hypothetical protein D1007_20673 [Hordeum vulgare]